MGILSDSMEMEPAKPSGHSPNHMVLACVFCSLVLFFIAGVVIFPIGYNIAYIQYPLPAYGTWRTNQAVVEDTKFAAKKMIPATSSSPEVAVGDCAVKLWFVIYHTVTGALQRPKRIAAWTTVSLPSPDVQKCKSLQTKNVNIYYNTKTPTTVKSQNKFHGMK